MRCMRDSQTRRPGTRRDKNGRERQGSAHQYSGRQKGDFIWVLLRRGVSASWRRGTTACPPELFIRRINRGHGFSRERWFFVRLDEACWAARCGGWKACPELFIRRINCGHGFARKRWFCVRRGCFAVFFWRRCFYHKSCRDHARGPRRSLLARSEAFVRCPALYPCTCLQP